MPPINGSPNDDVLNGTIGNDDIYGFDGSDTIRADSGNDLVDAGPGNDTIFGGDGDDTLIGGDGFDNITDGAGSDTVSAGGAGDTVFASIGPGNDSFDGGTGIDFDWIDYSSALAGVIVNLTLASGQARSIGTTDAAGIGIDQLANFECVTGSAFHDVITGDGETNIIYSASGNDTVFGGDGRDEVHSEDGDDLIDGGSGGDWLYGGNGNDHLIGGEGDDHLVGSAGDDAIEGGVGDDFIAGEFGNDTLTGNEGADTITGGDGADLIYGGDGDDNLSGEGGGTSYVGGEGSDTIYGGAGRDTIDGGGADDTIYGGDDADHIWGGLGHDYIEGGAGNDYIITGDRFAYDDFQSDSVYGGDGDDWFIGYYGDLIDGGSGIDSIDLWLGGSPAGIIADFRPMATGGTVTFGTTTLTGIEQVYYLVLSSFNDVIIAGPSPGADGLYIDGGAGDDDLTGSSKKDTINGGDGNDIIRGGVGVNAGVSPSTDQLYGAAGNDIIYIGADGATASGGGDDDRIYGGSANDIIYGDSGDDYIDAGGGNDTLDGGDGSDTLSYLSATSSVFVSLILPTQQNGTAGTDSIVRFENIMGSNFNDSLQGNASDNVITGGLGNDTIAGFNGTDTVSYADATAGVVVDLTLGSAQNTVGAGLDTLSSMENIAGSAHADTLLGDALGNSLFGNGGGDTLTGRAGADSLTGGAGADIFRDSAAGLNGDSITDLSIGDKIVITDATLAGFTFSLTGSTLTYTGGSLTLTGGVSGQLVAGAASGGGVQLTIQASVAIADVRNDFNGDGRSDILWRNVDGQLSNWLGQANGGFTPNNTNAAAVVPTDWQVVGTGDFNGDGRDDILWRHTSGTLSNWLGTTNGGYTPNDANAAAAVPTDWHVVGTGDFNGDGRDDILWRNNDGTLSNWLGLASGGFVANDANAAAPVPTAWFVAGTGDYNGDGRDDILWRNVDGQLSNWLGTASGGFTPNNANAAAVVPTDWHVIGTGDFNGDGRDDILWRNTNGTLSNWLGTANGGYTPNDANAAALVPIAWTVVAIGDYNGDGRDDILWRHTDGTLSNWLGTASGGFTPNDANAAAPVPTAWHVQPEPFL